MSESPPDDPFFIGWLPIPPAYRRFLIPVVAALVAATAVTAALVAFLQRDPGNGRWEADSVRTFDGLVTASPYAMLLVPGERAGEPARTFLLVEEGKFGALPRVLGLLEGYPHSRAVRATGTVLHRDGRWMLELAEGEAGMRPLSAAEAGNVPPAWPAPQLLADRATLAGEIIDPKCYLGAMKPGGGKTHKACAALCLRGGVPPMLVTRNALGHETFYLLVTDEGEPAGEAVVPFVGDPVEVTGRLERHGDLLVLRITSEGVRRR